MAVCPTCGLDAQREQYCPRDGTPLAHLGRGPAGMPKIGDRVDGRYALLEELGKGGMAVVFRAHAEALDREVALKVLYPRWGEDRKTVARFAREARATSHIDHDNVVKVYDFGYAPEGFYFLAMELLEGETLAKLLERAKSLRPNRAMHLLLEVADGMARAHELGVIHRDLKPENVLVRTNGGKERVTIVDFGLSKIDEGGEMMILTGEGDVLGTPDFMAPEQWQGGHVDARADVYAFGVMAYEMLSGALPFGGDTLIQKLQAHLNDVATPLAEHPKVAALPPGLSKLVASCMAKDPADRPPHAGKVLQILAAIDEESRQASAEPTRMGVGPAPTATVMAPVDDVGLDRLGLLTEIRRLGRVRQSRLVDLVPRVFGASPPGEVLDLLARIADAEAELSRSEEELALAEAALKEAQRANRTKEAELRAGLVEANLELAVLRDALPGEVTAPHARGDDTIAMDSTGSRPSEPPVDDSEAARLQRALRRAETRLASFVRATDNAVTDAEARLDAAIEQQSASEEPLEAPYAELERALREMPGADPSGFDELSQLEGALASYRVRLELLERHERRQAGLV